MRSLLRLAFLTAAATLAATAAQAHVGVAAHDHGGFSAGFLHPVTGLDHVGAMVAVGLWAATLGRGALLAVPAAFVALMTGGAVLGVLGIGLPAVEPMIAASVIVLGLFAAFAVAVPAPVAAGLVGFFALFHGHAHGAEMPALGTPILYFAGFVVATAALHAAGLGLGVAAGRADGRLTRFAGGLVAAFGVALAAF